MNIEAIALGTEDGLTLEAELARSPEPPRAAVVLCHPHPQFGGTMRSIVTSVLFDVLPAAGYSCLRFNFRGVERSEGTYSAGELEPLDVVAALGALVAAVPGVPVALVGWSFGADISLTVIDPRVVGWVAIVPPLRMRPSFGAATDSRPKQFVLVGHDEYREPDDVVAEIADWTATDVVIVPGASHFFVGRTDRVAEETRAGLDRITAR